MYKYQFGVRCSPNKFFPPNAPCKMLSKKCFPKQNAPEKKCSLKEMLPRKKCSPEKNAFNQNALHQNAPKKNANRDS